MLPPPPKYFLCLVEGETFLRSLDYFRILLGAWVVTGCPTSPCKVKWGWHLNFRLFFTLGFRQLLHMFSCARHQHGLLHRGQPLRQAYLGGGISGADFPPACSLLCYLQPCQMPSLFFSSIFASVLRRFEWLYRGQAGGKCRLCSVLHLKWGTSQHPHGLLIVNLLLLDELRRSLTWLSYCESRWAYPS